MTSASSANEDETEGVKKDSAFDQLIVSKNKKGSPSLFSNNQNLESNQPAGSVDVIDMKGDVNPRQISSSPSSSHTSAPSSRSSAVQMSSSSLSSSRVLNSHPAASSYWHHYNHHVNPNVNGIAHGIEDHAMHASPFSHHNFDPHTSHHFDPRPSPAHHYHPSFLSDGHYYHERHHPSEISKSGYQISAPNYISWNYRNKK